VGEPGRDLAGFALKLLLFKSVDEFDRGEEPNALAVMLDGLDADRRSEMRLGGGGSRQPRAARWLRGVTLAGGGHRAGHGGAMVVGGDPCGGCRLRGRGSNAAEAAWASP
jgi:hypothetical protein